MRHDVICAVYKYAFIHSFIQFSWENSTYLLGKLICLNGFGGLKYSKPALVTANYDPAAQQNIASGSHFSESWIANSRKSKQCENTGKKIRFGGEYFWPNFYR